MPIAVDGSIVVSLPQQSSSSSSSSSDAFADDGDVDADTDDDDRIPLLARGDCERRRFDCGVLYSIDDDDDDSDDGGG